MSDQLAASLLLGLGSSRWHPTCQKDETPSSSKGGLGVDAEQSSHEQNNGSTPSPTLSSAVVQQKQPPPSTVPAPSPPQPNDVAAIFFKVFCNDKGSQQSQEASREQINAQILQLLAKNNGIDLSPPASGEQPQQKEEENEVPVQATSNPDLVLQNGLNELASSLWQMLENSKSGSRQNGLNDLVSTLCHMLGNSKEPQRPQQKEQPLPPQSTASGQAQAPSVQASHRPNKYVVASHQSQQTTQDQQQLVLQSSGTIQSSLLSSLCQMLGTTNIAQASQQQVQSPPGSSPTQSQVPQLLPQLLATLGSSNDSSTVLQANDASSNTQTVSSDEGSDQQVASISTGGRGTSSTQDGFLVTNLDNPGPHDVLMGRGSGISNHIGNITYRTLIEKHKPKYTAASRADKPNVAGEVVALWRNMSPPGRFLVQVDSGSQGTTWKDVGDRRARQKTSQALREKERRKK